MKKARAYCSGFFVVNVSIKSHTRLLPARYYLSDIYTISILIAAF